MLSCAKSYDSKFTSKFSEYFKEMRSQHNYNTRGKKEGTIFKITPKNTTYGLNSLYHRATVNWNGLFKNNGLEFDKYFS